MRQRCLKSVSLIVIALLVCMFSFHYCANHSFASNKDVYDVVLFWGQSNMVGCCGLKKNEHLKDTRFISSSPESVKLFSQKTGIDMKLLSECGQMNWIKIKQIKNTAFDYVYTTNSLQEITADTKKIGERLKYNNVSKKLEVPTDSSFSIQRSYGTNLIPQFCKTYYEKTGHKVIAVLAANGGEKIANFLPSTDDDYGDVNRQMIYESMVEKYRAAIKYADDHELKIGNRLWVAFQGEADVGRITPLEYKRLFFKVQNNLKKDLKMEKGAIIATSHRIGTNLYEKVNNIHKAQKQLAVENKDIISGSSYAFDRYIPDQKTYNSSKYYNKLFTDVTGRKLAYTEAFEIASCSVCYPVNTIHFTSSALSQIGKETAESLAKVVRK